MHLISNLRHVGLIAFGHRDGAQTLGRDDYERRDNYADYHQIQIESERFHGSQPLVRAAISIALPCAPSTLLGFLPRKGYSRQPERKRDTNQRPRFKLERGSECRVEPMGHRLNV